MTAAGTILVVEDNPAEREITARLFRTRDYDVLACKNPDDALQHLSCPVDVVLTDLRMGEKSGIDLLRHWKQRRPTTPFVVLTGYAECGAAVEAMKAGAADFLQKPVATQELLDAVEKCVEHAHRRRELDELHARLNRPERLDGIVGESQVMRDLCDRARRAALSDATVLLIGESGTGKELFAAAIHDHSPRRAGPFVAVNMAAVPELLAESELFGHVEGAFTGAVGDRVGRFEAAGGGTLFIDEIGDFKLESQAKLLRVLESRSVTPVGSNEDRAVDVRVVTATSRDLTALVRSAKFREDLFYRLNVVCLRLPPLRERRADIPLLVQSFLVGLCEANGKPSLTIDDELHEFLLNHHWPGNVRQLRNVIESMVVLASDEILRMDDLPPLIDATSARAGRSSQRDSAKLEELERNAILTSLAQHNDVRVRAAAALGISVRTLQRKLRAWGLSTAQRHDGANGELVELA
jgi:DNA-binding NtrC family response regulator